MQTSNSIFHLGCGAFHRAHQLNYTYLTNQQSHEQWYYFEANIRSGVPLIKALKAQNWHYHLLEKGTTEQNIKEIDVIANGYCSNLDGAKTIIERMAEPDIKIVSLTITEKGYYIDPTTGKLDLTNPIIVQDLTDKENQQSAIGYIVRALELRKNKGLKGFTVMSCDNLMENGHIIGSAVLRFAQEISTELMVWIKENVSFPCTMVDRIVPAVTEDTLLEIEKILGKKDPCSVTSEAFKQWVIEDNFVAGRPEWDKAGAEFVDDVRPFEEMKLRMLNGTHSFLAYLGYLAGFEYISDCMQHPDFKRAAFLMMSKEQAPTLCTPKGIDLNVYANTLIERFENKHILHRTWQIAMDGSQKLPPRLLSSIAYHLKRNQDFSLLALAVAGWMRYVSGVDEHNQTIDVRDPMREEFAKIYEKWGVNINVVEPLLSLNQIFPTVLAQNTVFIDEVKLAYAMLLEKGSKATVAHYIAQK